MSYMFYWTIVKPTMLYGTAYWVVKNQDKNKLTIAEMRMLYWMCVKTLHNRIRNNKIRESWGNTYSRKYDGNQI